MIVWIPLQDIIGPLRGMALMMTDGALWACRS